MPDVYDAGPKWTHPGEGTHDTLPALAAAVVIASFLSAGTAYPQSASPDALAAAKELVVAARTTDQFKTLLPLIMQQLRPLIVQGRPEIERDYDKIMPVMMEAVNQQLGQFADEVATVYASNFTAEELRQVTAFYHTPVGQKFLEKMPVVAQQSMAMGQKFGQRITQDLQTRIKDELRKRGHNI